jgi:hypothetical protein
MPLSNNKLPSICFRQLQTKAYENQFESILKKSTSINEFNSALKHFYAMPAFEKAAKELINGTSEEQLFMLAKLRKQIDDFKKQNQTSITESSIALEKSFDNYNKQQEKYQTELVNLFLSHFSKYFKEVTEDLFDNFKVRISLQMAELGIEGNAKEQLNACIQSLEIHAPLIVNFKNALGIIKNSYQVDPELSQFIFIAREEAFSLVMKRIKNHLLNLNIKLVKTDYDNHRVLFYTFYQESIIILVNYYQDYKNKIKNFNPAFDILETDVGEPTKDWLDRYQHLSNSATFFSPMTPHNFKSICDELSEFKKQIKLENSSKFLKEIKNKIQEFLNTKIQLLHQEFQAYQAYLSQLASSFKLSQQEIAKLLEAKQSRYLAIQEKWSARKARLQLINNLEDLKNFKQHFPEEKLFSHSFDSEKTAFYSAFILLDESKRINELDLSKISKEDLMEKIPLILDNIDLDRLPHSVNNLLQFIHTESTDSIINKIKNYLADSLKNFFIEQSEKAAFCIIKTLNNTSSILEIKVHGNLLNYLRFINATELEKFKEKINAAYKNELPENVVSYIGQKLILTKETLNLFEENNTIVTVWDACLFFKKFYPSPLFNKKPLPFLNEKNNIVFLKAIESLNCLLRKLELVSIKKPIYSFNLFLKPNGEKQALMEDLINKLKNTPIAQASKNYINDFFTQWLNENGHIIKEPRYRLLIGIFMLIYNCIRKLFYPANFETTSYQTVQQLQKFFSSAYEDLEQIKVTFAPFSSKLNQNLSAESENSLIRAP